MHAQLKNEKELTMTHIFDDKKFKKLESPERYKIMPPEAVLKHLKIENKVIADVGCGIGYFSFPMAQSAKEVIALDISEIMIEEISRRVQDRKVNNITVKQNTSEHLMLDEKSVDLFFTSTLIHELDDFKAFTETALTRLRIGGHIAYFDFEKKETGFGPDVEKRIASESVMNLFEKLGLKAIQRYMVNDIFYLVIGEK